MPPLLRADPLCRLWFLRAVEAAGIEHFGRSSESMDDHVLAAMGYVSTPEGLSVRALRDALRESIQRFAGARPRGIIHANMARLARTVGLSPLESEVLLALLRLSEPSFRSFQKHDVIEGWQDVERLVAAMINVSRTQISRVLGTQSTLRRAGLVLDRKHRYGNLPIGPASHLDEALLRRHRSDDEFVRSLVPPATRGHLRLADYPTLVEQLGLMRALVRQGVRSETGALRAANVLLYGPPGTGKSELARAVTAEEGARLYEATVTDCHGDAASRLERLSHVAMCRWILAGRSDAVLVVDEAEDIFPSTGSGLFGFFRGASPENKGYVTRILELPRVPTIWITNSVSSIDEAFLRRFDLIIHVEAPRGPARQQLVEKAARRAGLDQETLERLTTDTRLAPATVARAVEVAGVAATHPELAGVSAARAVELVTEGFLRARGEQPRAPRRADALPWDPSLVHATPAVDAVVEAIVSRRVSRASLLLLGPPGTGKTELVRQLAVSSGRPLIERKASELLSKWVGETEKELAGMFHQARTEGAVLFLDEAESFLSARSEAHAPWQISQTNELLTRMADFEGLFVCATNLVDRFDEASFRRFDLKVTFHPLTPAQRARLLKSVFADVLSREALETLDGAAPHFHGLCTGDVVAVKRGMRLSGGAPSADDVTALLVAEVARRERRKARVIGFS